MSDTLPTMPQKPVPPVPPTKPTSPTLPTAPTEIKEDSGLTENHIKQHAVAGAQRKGSKIIKPHAATGPKRPAIKKTIAHRPSVAHGNAASASRNGTTDSIDGKGIAKTVAYEIYDIIFWRVKQYLIPFLGIDWLERKKWGMWILHLFLCFVIAPVIGYAMDGILYALIGFYVTGFVLTLIASFCDFED